MTTATSEQELTLRAATDAAVSDSPIWKRLQQVTIKLTDLHRELFTILQAEKQGKDQAYRESVETSVAARDRQGESFVLDLSLDILEMKGDIAALTEERDFLRLLIEHGNV